MTLAYQDAYAKIKALENEGVQLPIPAPTDAIIVGSVDARSGAFTFAVPTFEQTIRQQPLGGKPRPPIELTVGIVATNCVNLTLVFEVTNAQVANAPPAQALISVVGGGGIGVGGTVGSTGDVTISGFPPSGTQGSRIYLNAALAASAMHNSPSVTPGVETFPIGITVHGQLTYQHIAILRPPVLGVGGFTIPALPVAIIFAPPQGQLAKNSNTFNDKVTVSTTTTVSVSNQTDTKTAVAYTAADLFGKVSGLLTQIVALSAGVSALQTKDGQSASLINVISGPPGGGTLTGVVSGTPPPPPPGLGDLLKAVGAGYGVLGDIVSGLTDQGTNSDTSSSATTTNNTLTIAVTYSDTYGSEAGKGPGDGDRFLYLQDVLALWSNINGEVGLTVLGYNGVAAWSGDTLSADLQALASGGTTKSNLDAKTIQLLLGLDPYYLLPKIAVHLGPPLIGPPRFTSLSPLNRSGAGTSSTGDSFSLAVETIADMSTTNTSKNINVTDAKPGWIDVAVGADADSETTTTVTATNTVTSDQKSDQTITNTVTMLCGPGESYSINLYYDNFSQTVVPVSPNSPVLGGGILAQ